MCLPALSPLSSSQDVQNHAQGQKAVKQQGEEGAEPAPNRRKPLCHSHHQNDIHPGNCDEVHDEMLFLDVKLFVNGW